MLLKKIDTASLEQWVAQSSYIFRGRILALGKCNLNGVEPEPNMVTVKVEEVIVAPPDLGNITGSTMTVYFQSTGDLKAGQLQTIFASGWHLGKTIGVTEVGHVLPLLRPLRFLLSVRFAILSAGLSRLTLRHAELVESLLHVLRGLMQVLGRLGLAAGLLARFCRAILRLLVLSLLIALPGVGRA